MTQQLADEIEKFLTEKLLPEHGFVLIIGETETSYAGVISNYRGEQVVKIIQQLAQAAYVSGRGNFFPEQNN